MSFAKIVLASSALVAALAHSATPQEELRFLKTVIAAKTIKNSMREPESAQWELIMANDDASLICLQYRARNGFGGMARENVSVVKGAFSKNADTWNKHCGGKILNDMKHVKYAL